MNLKKIIISAIVLYSAVTGLLAGDNGIIVPAADAPNIIRVTSDSLILASGTTLSFTVDTPEDQGLVSTDAGPAGLKKQLVGRDGSPLDVVVCNPDHSMKTEGKIAAGDIVEITTGKKMKKRYIAGIERSALAGSVRLHQERIRTGSRCELVLDFVAGQRSPAAEVQIFVPREIPVTMSNTFVNVIGRGEVKLEDLSGQSIGRTGTSYSYNQVGQVKISEIPGQGQVIIFTGLDLRPMNGVDLRIRIKDVLISRAGDYTIKTRYTTSEPEIYTSPGTRQETAILKAVGTVTDFVRVMPRKYPLPENPEASFRWTPVPDAASVTLMQSTDNGRRWTAVPVKIDPAAGDVTVSGFTPGKSYSFRLLVKGGAHKGESNTAWFYSGKWDIRQFGVKGDSRSDDTEAINRAISSVHQLGGGILLFPAGIYPVRTVQLKSNVWLYIDHGAVIQALPGADAPESTWFSDKAYRSGLSPTDPRPYSDPENYLTKQDVGHTFFRNTMFFAEREDNIRIMGTGRITGNGNLATSDRVMNNTPDKRADKMFTFKLCTQIEIGGLENGKDLWYDPVADEPYYINPDGSKDSDISNMLHIDRGGHFVLLATGTDSIHVHNTYFGKADVSNSRDIYDFMACNHVVVTNIYSRVSSDDIVKLGSDCSLGFTRPVRDYMVRNIIGDTNCNLFQIGSETADDIQDVYVDNIYVLGSNKAGFSISTNDGAHIKNIYLNSGRTGSIHSRSVMLRTRAPFFISISNRGRVIGADVRMFTFDENGNERKELLCTNVNIGKVENVIIHGVDISEVYGGSSFRGERWKPYDGKQNEATPIIAGYKLPDPGSVTGGLGFRLPDGRHTGYITNIRFQDIRLKVKGGHPAGDINASPPELGVGRYNVGDLKTQPAYGFWVRHAKDLQLIDCTIGYEQKDERYPVVLDDVTGARIESLKVPSGTRQPIIMEINSRHISY